MLDRNRHQLLFALTVEASADPHSYHHLDAIHRKYHLRFDEGLLDSLITRWEDEGLVDVSRTHDGTLQAAIVRTRYSDALEKCAEWLGGQELKIDAKKEEIFSDVNPPDDIPLPSGWKWFTFEDSAQNAIKAPAAYGHTQEIVPEATDKVPTVSKTDWSKSAAIAAWLIIPITIIGILVMIYLDKAN